MRSINIGELHEVSGRRGSLAVLSLGLLGAVLTYLPLRFGSDGLHIFVLGVFVIAIAVMLCLPSLECFPLPSRVLLALFALRPLLDAAQSQDAQHSVFSLQNLFAFAIAMLLLILGRQEGVSGFVVKAPNNILIGLLMLSISAWISGGLGSGANGFLRTGWGLLLALLLGVALKTPKQIDTFIRIVFYSSLIVLLILAFNLKEGEYIGDTWRISGQFAAANTLAAVCFSLYVFGLYTFEGVRTRLGKTLSVTLLSGLAAAILLAQSRTVGALLFISTFFWLWVNQHRRIVYFLLAAILIVVLGSTLASEWRLTSSYSVQQKELSEDAINLTGRTLLWAKTLDQYASASLFNKITGLGWGTVMANFETFGFELSSVTENSFLWFLVGSGIAGFAAFSAYVAWLLIRTWKSWRCANNDFQRRLSLLAFLCVLTFLIEGFTTDLVLSPVSSGYLYAVLSVFAYQSIRNVSAEWSA